MYPLGTAQLCHTAPILTQTIECTKASLRVPDFTIDGYGSSCNFLFCSLIVIMASQLSLAIYLHPQGGIGYQARDKERKEGRMRTKKKELHELPVTKSEKSLTARPAFGTSGTLFETD